MPPAWCVKKHTHNPIPRTSQDRVSTDHAPANAPPAMTSRRAKGYADAAEAGRGDNSVGATAEAALVSPDGKEWHRNHHSRTQGRQTPAEVMGLAAGGHAMVLNLLAPVSRASGPPAVISPPTVMSMPFSKVAARMSATSPTSMPEATAPREPISSLRGRGSSPVKWAYFDGRQNYLRGVAGGSVRARVADDNSRTWTLKPSSAWVAPMV